VGAPIKVVRRDDWYKVVLLGKTTQEEAEVVGHGKAEELDTAKEQAFGDARRHLGDLTRLVDKAEEEVEVTARATSANGPASGRHSDQFTSYSTPAFRHGDI
jgi:hypothetical protein